MNKIHTIFSDMDGVHANFHLEAVRAHLRAGKRFPVLQHYGSPLELTEQFLHRRWHKGVSLQKFLSNVRDGHPKMTSEQFWEPIDLDPLFWNKIDPYSHSKKLLELLKPLCQHLVICTAPHTHPTSYSGKRAWLYTYNMHDLELIMIKHKWRLADPNAVLIDDLEDHVYGYIEECQKRFGVPGKAILFPAVWNENHAFANDPVAYVAEKLKTYLKD